jgi:thiol:disulfide interchange protein DsbD
MLVINYGGVFVTGTLIAILTEMVRDKIAQLREGRSRVIESGHTVILGWSSQTLVLIRELATAKAEGQWVLVDYYADWCVSCKIMEKTVFGNPEVQDSLQGVRVLRPDVTESNAASRALLSRFDVLGPPTLLWIGPDGEERRSQRITGAVDAERFLQIWTNTKERG